MPKRFSHNDYTVAWICALTTEMRVAVALLDEEHDSLPQPDTDQNVYVLGEISGHRVVIATRPAGVYGTTSVATMAARLKYSFSKIQVTLLVGIGGGVPSERVDIRLGDVVVGLTENEHSAVFKYHPTRRPVSFITTRPSESVLHAVRSLKYYTLTRGNPLPKTLSNVLKRHPRLIYMFSYPGSEKDLLFAASYEHVDGSLNCSNCRPDELISRPPRAPPWPQVHYGPIVSERGIMKNGLRRDQIAQEYPVLCFETEAADWDKRFPCLVIRGICDYADSHKNKEFQGYAAATAACYAKEVISRLPRDGMQSIIVRGEHTKSHETDAFTNSSANYQVILKIQQAEVALERLAQRKGLGSGWRESIVDLLNLLGLDSSLQTRNQLANLLNVHTGSPNSAVQNISLHQAVFQELARNGGELPANMRNQLVSAKFRATEEASISDESDVESIFSDDSIASSQSSSSQTANSALEIAYLLLKNETLSPLFEIAFAKYDISKLRKKLKRLISGYGSDLASEASSDVQTEVAKFVQGAARRVTIQLTRAMVSEIKYDFISNRRGINKLLESLPANQQTPSDLVEKTSDHPQEPLSDSDSDQSEPENDLAPRTLEEVEHFMVVSRAFNTLVGGLRKWLGVLDEDLDDSTQNRCSETRHAILGEMDNNDTDRTATSSVPETSQQQLEVGANQTTSQMTAPIFVRRLVSALALLEPMFWPKPPEGFKRITWRSPLGKPLCIDVTERVDGAAERLQEKFRASAQKTSAASSSPSYSSSPGPSSSGTFGTTPRAPPPAHVVGSPSNQSPRRGHDQPGRTVSAIIPDNIRQMDRKYLLVCFSTHKSEILKEIDVTFFATDQSLFDILRLNYRAIKTEESWFSNVPFLRSVEVPSWLSWCLGDLHLYKPEKINFVSFKLMPLGEVPTPFNIRAPSLPPEQEVRMKKWHYSPCPIEVEEWAISKAFATKLLEPGHAFRDAEWLELFPKKLRLSFTNEPGNKSVLWGINIIEGLNKAAVAWLALLVMILSAALGLIYSLASHDVSAAFTLAAWFATFASLSITYFQFRR
ncbi:hypothetical protein IFM53868_07811 [Aspergillus udagawae]|uniref:DUF3597 domain-containing protein n=1 Tax=Aspergillus udagawae TaxID=91492 RepID=A0ABQ1B7U9_9EURO|nr:hypothetical protein IFM53868_07811 [Aspergillus udagawae]